MSEQSEVVAPTASSSTVQRSGLLDDVRQLAYAWVGMWAVASEDLGSFYQRCRVRGEQIMNTKPSVQQPEVKPPAPDAMEVQRKNPASKTIRPMSVFNAFGAVESYHVDLNVDKLLPTKEELDAITERVEALAREVDALAKQREHD